MELWDSGEKTWGKFVARIDEAQLDRWVASEKLTTAAISYLQTGSCPAVAAAPGRAQALSVSRGGARRTTEAGERQGMWAN